MYNRRSQEIFLGAKSDWRSTMRAVKGRIRWSLPTSRRTQAAVVRHPLTCDPPGVLSMRQVAITTFIAPATISIEAYSVAVVSCSWIPQPPHNIYNSIPHSAMISTPWSEPYCAVTVSNITRQICPSLRVGDAMRLNIGPQTPLDPSQGLRSLKYFGTHIPFLESWNMKHLDCDPFFDSGNDTRTRALKAPSA